jgi:hypothetical protein
VKAPNTAVSIPNNRVGMFSSIPPYLDWSQTSAGQAPGNATFSFATGWQGANTLPNFLYLRLANDRGKNLQAGNGSALQIRADKQTVYDPMTDITWAATANLAAANTFGLPRCTDPTAPAICVAQEGSMSYASAIPFIANMNSAAYLGQKNWQMPSIDASRKPSRSRLRSSYSAAARTSPPRTPIEHSSDPRNYTLAQPPRRSRRNCHHLRQRIRPNLHAGHQRCHLAIRHPRPAPSDQNRRRSRHRSIRRPQHRPPATSSSI